MKKKNGKPKLLGRYIVIDPEIRRGRPSIRGTRILVSDILELIELGMTPDQLVRQWDGKVKREAVTNVCELLQRPSLVTQKKILQKVHLSTEPQREHP